MRRYMQTYVLYILLVLHTGIHMQTTEYLFCMNVCAYVLLLLSLFQNTNIHI